MPTLEVTIARSRDKNTIANLMQFYVHDFSEQWSGTPRGELEADGRYPEYPLDPYWCEAGHIPLLLKRDERPVGFALINSSAHSGGPIDHNMAEFFVVRKHRRSGLGTAAVHTLLNRYPGSWEIAVARRNTGALAFWRNALKRHLHLKDMQESDLANATWNGPVLRFRSPSLDEPS